MEPDCRCGQHNNDDMKNFDEFKAMFMVVVMFR
jgi:hypothetical protein